MLRRGGSERYVIALIVDPLGCLAGEQQYLGADEFAHCGAAPVFVGENIMGARQRHQPAGKSLVELIDRG